MHKAAGGLSRIRTGQNKRVRSMPKSLRKSSSYLDLYIMGIKKSRLLREKAVFDKKIRRLDEELKALDEEIAGLVEAAGDSLRGEKDGEDAVGHLRKMPLEY